MKFRRIGDKKLARFEVKIVSTFVRKIEWYCTYVSNPQYVKMRGRSKRYLTGVKILSQSGLFDGTTIKKTGLSLVKFKDRLVGLQHVCTLPLELGLNNSSIYEVSQLIVFEE